MNFNKLISVVVVFTMLVAIIPCVSVASDFRIIELEREEIYEPSSDEVVNNLTGEIFEQEPTEIPASIMLNKNETYSFDLDEFGFETGKIYTISWNMIPETDSGWEIIKTWIDGGDFTTGSYGLASYYNNNLIMGSTGWIGDVGSNMLPTITTEGLNVVVLWDTDLGSAEVSIGNSIWTYDYTWDAGVVSEDGNFGKLNFRSATGTLNINNFEINLFEVEQIVNIEAISNCSGGTAVGGGEYIVGETATLTATVKPGYIFAGWYDGENLVSSDVNFEVTVLEEKTYIAWFEEEAISEDILYQDNDVTELAKNERYEIDLDVIGMNVEGHYKISFNVNHEAYLSTEWNALVASFANSDLSIHQWSLINQISGDWYINGSWIGNALGIKGAIPVEGLDVVIDWDVKEGKATITLSNSGGTLTGTWVSGTIDETGKFGKFYIISYVDSAVVKNMIVETVDVTIEEPEQEPTEETTEIPATIILDKSEIYSLDLDMLGFESGKTYTISWNMIPEENSGWEIIKTWIDGGSFENGSYGLASYYNDNLIMAFDKWIGTMGDNMLPKVTTEGLNVTIVWDTKKGKADINVGNSAWNWSYEWNSGTLPEDGNFGKLNFKSSVGGLVVNELSVEYPQDEGVDEEPEYTHFVYEENFDDWTSTENEDWSIGKEYGEAEIDEGALKIHATERGGTYTVTYTLPESLTRGVYKFTYKYKFTNPSMAYHEKAWAKLYGNVSSKMIMGIERNWMSDPSNVDWYGWMGTDVGYYHTYEVVLDLDNKTFYELKFGAPWKNWVSESKSGSLTTGGGITSIEFGVTYADDDDASGKVLWIDDILLETYSNIPHISEEDVVITDKTGVKQDNFNSVSPTSRTIDINFGMNMYTGKLTEDYVYITNKDGDKLAGEYDFAGGILTIELDENLVPGENYTLFVSEEVKNATGEIAGEDFELTFKAGAGLVKSTLLKNTDGSINVEYMNSTGVRQSFVVVISHYKANKLVKSKYVKYDKAEDVYTETIRVSVENPVETYDTVKIMTWDGFDTMKSISNFITIPEAQQ